MCLTHGFSHLSNAFISYCKSCWLKNCDVFQTSRKKKKSSRYLNWLKAHILSTERPAVSLTWAPPPLTLQRERQDQSRTGRLWSCPGQRLHPQVHPLPAGRRPAFLSGHRRQESHTAQVHARTVTHANSEWKKSQRKRWTHVHRDVRFSLITFDSLSSALIRNWVRTETSVHRYGRLHLRFPCMERD